MRTTAGGILPRAWAIAVVMAQAISPQTPPPSDPAPLYAESSIVNAASPAASGLAPNTLGTIYGRFLAYGTYGVSADDIRSGSLPTALAGSSVRVLIGGIPAPLLYVSPEQINFLVPAELLPGRTDLRVGRVSLYGPAVRLDLHPAAPALFLADPEFAISVPAEAKAGEVVTLYATGLGETKPRPETGQILRTAAPLLRLADFRVVVEGLETAVLYAGLAPGFAGLYQVNIRLPEIRNRNPEIRIGFDGMMSPAGIRLHASLGEPTSSRIRQRFQLNLFQELYAPVFAVHSVDLARRRLRR